MNRAEDSGRDEAMRQEVTELTLLLGGDSSRGTVPVSPRSRENAMPRLFELTYEELKRLAAVHLRRERPNHTLQPTALVHEAFLRLVDQTSIHPQGRAQFFAIASRAMRRLLVDHARRISTTKRGEGYQRVTLNSQIGSEEQASAFDALTLDRALTELSEFHRRAGQIAEFKLFSELTVREIAELLNSSERTIAREWKLARAWLGRHLREEGDAQPG